MVHVCYVYHSRLSMVSDLLDLCLMPSEDSSTPEIFRHAIHDNDDGNYRVAALRAEQQWRSLGRPQQVCFAYTGGTLEWQIS